MAKTAAEKQKSYRDRKRNAQAVVTHDSNATLPIDVQADIERMCSENNKGVRSASHSRAAMTDLKYHKMFGGSKEPTGKCLACGGPVQHPSVVKCLKCCTCVPAPQDSPVASDFVGKESPEVHGPLDVYSEARWARLQDKYEWDEVRGVAVRADGVVLVPVPGDPAYKSEVVDAAEIHAHEGTRC